MQYLFKADILLFAMIFAIIDCSGAVVYMDLAAGSRAPGVLGGPCEYKQYKGKAKIVAITKREMPDNSGRPLYESFEVKFSFCPEEEIKETYGQVQGKEYTMMLKNSSYPGPEFLEKYKIQTGKRYDCYLKVIIRGTCTPVLFDFPTIDLGDYFELKR